MSSSRRRGAHARRSIACLAATAVCALAACGPAADPTSSGASATGSLDAATQQLVGDATRLLEAARLRAAQDGAVDDDSCLPGEVRRLYRAAGDLPDPAPGLLEVLSSMGYAEIEDDLDLRDEDDEIAVLRHPDSRLVFELTVHPHATPNVEIVGKTTCYRKQP
ncbi:hypothetical protein [Nonomuraea pusilla]|uniref:Lipoprotein n=1 Tax=Nonomuraea pusilla TaxID=46177 RepID=A0A1H8A9G6_9ACTN|nr:hypothetical protein [Nonomuraea pusilla]SEM67532.1 hypothetical protein SAMN05660976_05754 [Nonomuraea pusilla]